MSGADSGFVSGIRVCVDMLLDIDMDESTLVTSNWRGHPQDNAVRRVLAKVLMRGDAQELNGFCAALTEVCASADDNGDYSRMLASYVNRRDRVVRRRLKGRAVVKA